MKGRDLFPIGLSQQCVTGGDLSGTFWNTALPSLRNRPGFSLPAFPPVLEVGVGTEEFSENHLMSGPFSSAHLLLLFMLDLYSVLIVKLANVDGQKEKKKKKAP